MRNLGYLRFGHRHPTVVAVLYLTVSLAGACSVITDTGGLVFVEPGGECTTTEECAVPANSVVECQAGSCVVLGCTAGYDNCDGNQANGCEVDITSDLSHCGGCGEVCAIPSATAICTDRVCSIGSCLTGFENCDGNVNNGCEAQLGSQAHCTACNVGCSGMTPICDTTGATNTCVENCAGTAESTLCGGSCVDTTSDPLFCGGCTNRCGGSTGQEAMWSCNASMCVIDSCNTGFGDCDVDISNGCETDTTSSTDHCSACGMKCGGLTGLNSSWSCSASTCEIAMCTAPFLDCANGATDGCEADSSSDLNNCGGCGVSCSGDNATWTCDGTCQVDSCDVGFDDCNASATDGCEIDIRTNVMHCGACNKVCDGMCVEGVCDPVVDVALGLGIGCTQMLSGKFYCWGYAQRGDRG